MHDNARHTKKSGRILTHPFHHNWIGGTETKFAMCIPVLVVAAAKGVRLICFTNHALGRACLGAQIERQKEGQDDRLRAHNV